MAFPQGTPLNTSLSEAQSVANASALCGSAAILPLVAMLCDIFNPPVSGRWNPTRTQLNISNPNIASHTTSRQKTEERRAGKECVSKYRYRVAPYQSEKKKIK